MMQATAKDALLCASSVIATAVEILRPELPTMEAFLKEARDMENFGHIIAPTLYRDQERRAVSALLEPLFEQAVSFVKLYDGLTAKSKEALAKVQAER